MGLDCQRYLESKLVVLITTNLKRAIKTVQLFIPHGKFFIFEAKEKLRIKIISKNSEEVF